MTEPGGGVELGRILDASVNRAREGLRVIEDYVRFVLNDPGLTRRLKEVRHRLAQAERGLDSYLLLGSRDTRDDVGTHIMTPSEQIREAPRAVLAANFKRIAESLRSLEEYSKLIDVWIAGRYEVLRYDIYTLEKLTMTAVAAQAHPGRCPADGPDRRLADSRRPHMDRGRGDCRRRRCDPVSRQRDSRPRAAEASASCASRPRRRVSPSS